MRTDWITVFIVCTLSACMPSRGTRAPQSSSETAGDSSDEAHDEVASGEVAAEVSELGPETSIVEAIAACTSAGIQSITSLGDTAEGTYVKVAGTLAFPLQASCGDPLDCSGPAALADSTTVALRDPWSCFVVHSLDTPHSTATVCSPGVLGVRYRVWGRGGPHDGDLLAGVGSIAVDDYCLDTEGDALLGRYRGTLEIADVTLSFNATIRMQDGRRVLTYSSPERAPSDEADPIPGGVVNLDIGDGYVDLEEGALYEPYLGLTNPEAGVGARLHSQRNRLVGGYTDLAKQRTAVITLDRID